MSIVITTQPKTRYTPSGSNHVFSIDVGGVQYNQSTTTQNGGSVAYENDKDGNASSAQTISATNNPGYETNGLFSGTSNYFMGCYARIDSITANNAHILGTKRKNFADMFRGISLTDINTQTFNLGIRWIKGISWAAPVVASTQPTLGQWHHFAFMQRDGSWYLFLDGALVATTTNPILDLFTEVFIGDMEGAIGGGFNGAVDKVFITYAPSFDPASGFNPDDVVPGGAISPLNFYEYNGTNANTGDVFAPSPAPADITYEWYVNDVAVENSDTNIFSGLQATLDNSYSRVFASATDNQAEFTVFSETVLAISTPPESSINKHALLWNYNNNTFSWKDPSVEMISSGSEYNLFDADYQTYGFSPGFQQRWDDWKDGAYYASTWSAAGSTSWADTFSRGSDREMIVISQGQAFESNKTINRDNSLKKYFVERSQIDFDGLSQEFRSGKIKQTKRFVMDIQADQGQIQETQSSTVNFYVGWSLNLMEPPNYKAPVLFDLQSRYFGGSYKVDYRSSGRYMGMYFDLTDAAQMSFSGGEVEVAQTSGR